MKRNRVFLYAISFFQGMVFYSSVATLYRQAAGLSVFQITLIESVSMALSLAFEVPWGILADRIGYRRTMILCGAVYFISKLVFWRASDLAGFLLERVLLAVVVSGLSGVDTSMLYLSCEEGDSQRAFGIYQTLSVMGLLLAAVVFLVSMGENYRMAGFFTVISYGVAAALGFGLREVKAGQRRERASFGQSFRILRETLLDRRLLLLVAGVALLSEVNQTVTVFFNQLQYTRSGMTVRMISTAYILTTVSGLAGLFSAPLTGRLKPKPFGAALFGVCGCSCLMLAVTESPVASVFGILLIRVCFSLLMPLGTELQNQAITTDDRATALSMNTLVMDLLAVFTNLAFGRLADIHLSAAMCFGGVLCLLGMSLYLGSFRD